MTSKRLKNMVSGLYKLCNECLQVYEMTVCLIATLMSTLSVIEFLKLLETIYYVEEVLKQNPCVVIWSTAMKFYSNWNYSAKKYVKIQPRRYVLVFARIVSFLHLSTIQRVNSYKVLVVLPNIQRVNKHISLFFSECGENTKTVRVY